jgi:hypothetical protein
LDVVSSAILNSPERSLEPPLANYFPDDDR